MKNNTTTQFIAKEGWKYLFVIAVVFVVSMFFNFLSWVVLVIFALTLYLFRNPERLPAEDDDMAILAPADGTVFEISKVKYRDGKEYIKVGIQKSLLEVSLLRSPTKINILKTDRRHGLFLPLSNEYSKELGEKVSLSCQSNYNNIFMDINAGMFSRKIDLFKTVGPLKTAQRFGLLVDGSVVLYLPLDSRVKVAVGDELKAGESVLGYFAHKESS